MAKIIDILEIPLEHIYFEAAIWDDKELSLEIDDSDGEYAECVLSQPDAKKLYEFLKKHYDN